MAKDEKDVVTGDPSRDLTGVEKADQDKLRQLQRWTLGAASLVALAIAMIVIVQPKLVTGEKLLDEPLERPYKQSLSDLQEMQRYLRQQSARLSAADRGLLSPDSLTLEEVLDGDKGRREYKELLTAQGTAARAFQMSAKAALAAQKKLSEAQRPVHGRRKAAQAALVKALTEQRNLADLSKAKAELEKRKTEDALVAFREGLRSKESIAARLPNLDRDLRKIEIQINALKVEEMPYKIAGRYLLAYALIATFSFCLACLWEAAKRAQKKFQVKEQGSEGRSVLAFTVSDESYVAFPSQPGSPDAAPAAPEPALERFPFVFRTALVAISLLFLGWIFVISQFWNTVSTVHAVLVGGLVLLALNVMLSLTFASEPVKTAESPIRELIGQNLFGKASAAAAATGIAALVLTGALSIGVASATPTLPNGIDPAIGGGSRSTYTIDHVTETLPPVILTKTNVIDMGPKFSKLEGLAGEIKGRGELTDSRITAAGSEQGFVAGKTESAADDSSSKGLDVLVEDIARTTKQLRAVISTQLAAQSKGLQDALTNAGDIKTTTDSDRETALHNLKASKINYATYREIADKADRSVTDANAIADRREADLRETLTSLRRGVLSLGETYRVAVDLRRDMALAILGAHNHNFPDPNESDVARQLRRGKVDESRRRIADLNSSATSNAAALKSVVDGIGDLEAEMGKAKMLSSKSIAALQSSFDILRSTFGGIAVSGYAEMDNPDVSAQSLISRK